MKASRSTALLISLMLLAGCAGLSPGSPPASPPAATPSATADAPAPTPTHPAPTVGPSPSAPVTPAPTASPFATPTPSTTWVGPQRLAAGGYEAVALDVDGQGSAHVAASLEGAIVYLTNSSGDWRQQTVTVQPGPDEAFQRPSIGIDGEGWAHIAFERARCSEMGCTPHAIHVVSGSRDEWSERAIVDGSSPWLAVLSGRVHLAFVAPHRASDVACGARSPISYVASAVDSWNDVQVSPHGQRPLLRLAVDGTARIAFTDLCGFVGSQGIWYASGDEDDDFSVEPILDTLAGQSGALALALDAAGQPHVLFWEEPDDEAVTFYTRREEAGWEAPVEVASRQLGKAIAVDSFGAVHVLTLGRDGASYITNSGGEMAVTPLSESGAFPWNGGALVVDDTGRAHMVFVTGDAEEGDAELWYAIAPVSG